MNDENALRRLETLERAVSRLEETLAAPADTPFLSDATIQRFEFSFELFWITLRGLLELSGRNVERTPRGVIKAAYAARWIDDEAGWIELMRMRNATSHIYNEAMAQEIYERIRSRASLLRDAVEVLKQRFP